MRIYDKILLNHRGHRVEINKSTEKIIGCVIEVHKELAPGLLESTYNIQRNKIRQWIMYNIQRNKIRQWIMKSF
jgi:hypothetical protein